MGGGGIAKVRKKHILNPPGAGRGETGGRELVMDADYVIIMII